MKTIISAMLPAFLLMVFCATPLSAETYPTATKIFTFNRDCGAAGESTCYESITFPLNISSELSADTGTVRVAARIVHPYCASLWIKLERLRHGSPIQYTRDQWTDDAYDSYWEYNRLGSMPLWGDYTLWVGSSSRSGGYPCDAGVTNGAGYSVEVSLTYPVLGKTQPQSLFSAVNKANGRTILSAVVKDRIEYSGEDWNPKKGPIQVYLGDKLLKRFKAGKSFKGQFRLPWWARGDCTAALRAVQGRTSRTVALAGRRLWLIEGVTREYRFVDDRMLKKGGFICEGERLMGCDPHQALVVRALESREVSGFSGLGIWACGKRGSTWIDGVYAEKVQIRVAGTKIRVNNGPSVNLTEWDPIVRPDRHDLQRTLNNPTLYDWNRCSGDLKIVGDLRMKGSLLYVAGDLLVTGSIGGKGTIIATGTITLGKGDEAHLSNDLPLSVSPGVTMAAGDGVVFKTWEN